MKEELDLYSFEGIAFLNGQPSLHEREESLYKYLVDKHAYPIVLDDLFKNPEKLKVLSTLQPEAICLGTTGTFVDKLNMLFDAFDMLGYRPKIAIITMGEDCLPLYKETTRYRLWPYDAQMIRKGIKPIITKLD